MRRTPTFPLLATCGAALLLGAAGVSTAHAAPPSAAATSSSTPAPVPSGPSAVTLPLFGVPMTVELASATGVGLTTVTVNPADGFTQLVDKPNRVVFENTDGTARIVVKTGRGTQSVEASARSLDAFLAGGGAGSWSGDVFGTGTTTTVGYVVTGTAEAIGLTGITSSDPTARIGSVETDHDGDETEAKVRITFSDGTRTRTLTIKVEVDRDDDDDDRAEVKVSLSRLRGPDSGSSAADPSRSERRDSDDDDDDRGRGDATSTSVPTTVADDDDDADDVDDVDDRADDATSTTEPSDDDADDDDRSDRARNGQGHGRGGTDDVDGDDDTDG